MKYTSAILIFSSLLSVASALKYTSSLEVSPTAKYALVTEKDGQMYALESTGENSTGGRAIDPKNIGSDLAIQWSFPNSIPVQSEDVDTSGHMMSVATQGFLGMAGADVPYSTTLDEKVLFLAYAKAQLDGSILVNLYGSYIRFDGNGAPFAQDDPALPKWKLVQIYDWSSMLDLLLPLVGGKTERRHSRDLLNV